MKTSKQVKRLWQKRSDIIRMYYQRANNLIISWLQEHDIHAIVVGRNRGWKQESGMGKANNQKFAYIPYSRILADLRSKCQMAGITFIETEESWTSKASFIDGDGMPGSLENSEDMTFSGKRTHRGLYRTKAGILINADINGACNILKKVYPHAFDNTDIRKLLNPGRVRIQQYMNSKRYKNVTVMPA